MPAGRSSCASLATAACATAKLCDLRIGKVRLHDRGKARFHIPDAKTETGIREVEMSPDLADAFVTHLDRARRLRRPECARRSRQPPAHREGHPRGGRARQPDPGAALSAAAAADHPAHTPPDICLERTSANKFDVKWVMGQVGHADSKMTMDVYTHLQQRLKREHSEAFEAMIREAEELMPRQRRPRDRRRRPRRDRARTPRRPAVLHRLRPSAVLRLLATRTSRTPIASAPTRLGGASRIEPRRGQGGGDGEVTQGDGEPNRGPPS
jgi:hypothetical protein